MSVRPWQIPCLEEPSYQQPHRALPGRLDETLRLEWNPWVLIDEIPVHCGDPVEQGSLCSDQQSTGRTGGGKIYTQKTLLKQVKLRNYFLPQYSSSQLCFSLKCYLHQSWPLVFCYSKSFIIQSSKTTDLAIHKAWFGWHWGLGKFSYLLAWD